MEHFLYRRAPGGFLLCVPFRSVQPGRRGLALSSRRKKIAHGMRGRSVRMRPASLAIPRYMSILTTT